MELKYGVNADNALVSIEEVSRGKTNLVCPYCGEGLVAKKGKIKEHHFAHHGVTCLKVAKRQIPTLPLYDKFNIYLSATELEELKIFWKNYGARNEQIWVKPPFKLILSKLLIGNERGNYEFTHLGKIPVGALPLSLFNEVQEPLLLAELEKLELAAERANKMKSRNLEERIADLRIYRAQLRRILENCLYFLAIQADGKTLHKIGITKRSIQERIIEVRRDLAAYYKFVEIQVIDTWNHRGNVELYFKHRYKDFNYKIGTLTEYFQFDDVAAVREDLQQMKPKNLAAVELEILEESNLI